MAVITRDIASFQLAVVVYLRGIELMGTFCNNVRLLRMLQKLKLSTNPEVYRIPANSEGEGRETVLSVQRKMLGIFHFAFSTISRTCAICAVSRASFLSIF